jgi:hypothetical protein
LGRGADCGAVVAHPDPCATVTHLDAATILAIAIPPLTTIRGVVLGWKLSADTARAAAREEREWAERHTVRQRQETAAEALDNRVMEATRDLPAVQGPAIEVAAAYDRVRINLLRAWARSTVLDDPEIERRIRALDMALFVDAQHGRTLRPSVVGGRPIEPTLNPWPIQVAVTELRMALAYFQRREEAPAAQFQTAEEIVELAHPEGGSVGLDAVRDLLTKRQVSRAMISP